MEHRQEVSVCISHYMLDCNESNVQRAVHALLPPDYSYYGKTVWFKSGWDIEPALDDLQRVYGKLRYQLIEDKERNRGVLRVHINKRGKKITTKCAKKRISVCDVY